MNNFLVIINEQDKNLITFSNFVNPSIIGIRAKRFLKLFGIDKKKNQESFDGTDEK